MSAHSKVPLSKRFRLRLHPMTAAVLILVLVALVFAGVSRGAARSVEATDGALAMTGDESVDHAFVDATGSDGAEPLAQSASREGTAKGNEAAQGGGEAGLYVFVTGAVKEPGVVTVPAGSRAQAAVLAAGGLLAEAEMTSVNLAALLTDGEHIHVLAVGEAPLSGYSGGGVASTSEGVGADGGCVDLNSASAEQLQALDGVGPKISARIVERREAIGGFGSAEELMSVSGIGQALYARISAGLCQ